MRTKQLCANRSVGARLVVMWLRQLSEPFLVSNWYKPDISVLSAKSREHGKPRHGASDDHGGGRFGIEYKRTSAHAK